MSEEKKEGCGCSNPSGYPSKGCGCCKGAKLLFALLMAAFIFASGMWFAQAHCHCHMGGYGYCPFSGGPATK